MVTLNIIKHQNKITISGFVLHCSDKVTYSAQLTMSCSKKSMPKTAWLKKKGVALFKMASVKK